MIRARAAGETREIAVSAVVGIQEITGIPGQYLVTVRGGEIVVASGADIARAFAPVSVTAAPGSASVPKRTAKPRAAAGTVARTWTGPGAQFYKACVAAEYQLCRICVAYRPVGHGDCGPDYLYRDMGMGQYQGDAVRVELTGGLEGQGPTPDACCPRCEAPETPSGCFDLRCYCHEAPDHEIEDTGPAIPEPICEAVTA